MVAATIAALTLVTLIWLMMMVGPVPAADLRIPKLRPPPKAATFNDRFPRQAAPPAKPSYASGPAGTP